MPALVAPPPHLLRDLVRDVSARLAVARTTGQLEAFVQSMKELDAAWRSRRDDVESADLIDMTAEMSNLFAELRSLIEERAGRHADVVMRPRSDAATRRTVPSWRVVR